MPNEKDIVEKWLFDQNDVFADIINGTLFGGEQRVRPEELESTRARSQLKAAGTVHEQERDVVKLWKAGGVAFALLGLENQSVPDRHMPMRVFAYDGASYKEQVIAYDRAVRSRQPLPKLYPVITVVLNFGETKWNTPRTLRECFDPGIPEELRNLAPDYCIHVVDVSWLAPEELKQFQSDFRLIADLFVQSRSGAEYQPPEGDIQHLHEFLTFLGVMLEDRRYNEVLEELEQRQQTEGGTNMCRIADELELRGKAAGIIAAVKRLGKPMAEAAELVSALMQVPPEEAEAQVNALWETV